MKKKRKYVRRKGLAVIHLIARVRGRNNRLWMKLLELAIKGKPRESRRIIKKITENDQEVSKWTARI